MNKVRKICLILTGLFVIAGVVLALVTRKNQEETSRLFSDERLGVLEFRMDRDYKPLPVPTLAELESAAEEILVIRPVGREQYGVNARLEASVQKIYSSTIGLKEGDTIRLFEPYSIMLREGGGTNTLYDSSYMLPMWTGQDYLVFLSHREISDLYDYPELDLKTFLMCSTAVSAFPIDPDIAGRVYQLREFLLNSELPTFEYTATMTESERNAYQAARIHEFPKETHLVRSLSGYAFVTSDYFGFIPDEEAAAALVRLSEEALEKYR